MPGLQAPLGQIFTGKAVGDVMPSVARLRNTTDLGQGFAEAAYVAENLQRQVNALAAQLAAAQPALQKLEVTDTLGSLIAWIGSALVGGVSYVGAWFKQFAIGGTSIANAKIISDANGNVTINGATFVFTANGTQTIINGSTNPWSTKGTSLISKDVASNMYSMVDPFDFALLTPLNAPIAYIRNVPVGTDPNGVLFVASYPTYSLTFAGNQLIVSDSATGAGFAAEPDNLSISDGGSNTTTLNADGSFNMPNAFFASTGELTVTNLTVSDGVDTSTLAPDGTLALPNASVNAAGEAAFTEVVSSGDIAGATINGAAVPNAVLAANGSQQFIAATAGTGIDLTGTTITNTAPFPAGGFSGTVVLKGPTTDGSLTVSDGLITAAVDPT